MKNILIIVDKFGWSYDTIAKGLVKYADNQRFCFDIVSVGEDMAFIEKNHDRYDLVFAMGWTLVISKKKKHHYRELLPFLDRRKLISGIHSHRSWDDYLSMPDELPLPAPALLERLAGLKGINIISRRLYRIFKQAGLNNITLTENGVDTELFRPGRPVSTRRDKPLVIGFSGSKDIAKHDYLKGFSEFILPLNEIANVEVKTLGGRGEHQVKREDMPALYHQIDLYICASTSEGFSQSVLEAASCARGVISTRVGGCEDLIEQGYNGYFINRDLNEIKALVVRLEADRDHVGQLGHNSRKRIVQHYSWAIQVQHWLRFIESHLCVP
jgi:glycosyltransferase involved in cell wall biosynthesis